MARVKGGEKMEEIKKLGRMRIKSGGERKVEESGKSDNERNVVVREN